MRGFFIAALAVFALTAQPVVAKDPADLLIRHATVVDVEHAQNYPGIGLHDELALYVDNGLTLPRRSRPQHVPGLRGSAL